MSRELTVPSTPLLEMSSVANLAGNFALGMSVTPKQRGGEKARSPRLQRFCTRGCRRRSFCLLTAR